MDTAFSTRFNALDSLNSSLRPSVYFALRPTAVAGWQNHPDNSPSRFVYAPTTRDADGWSSRASETLSLFMTDARRQSLFTQPFLAMSIVRLSDGSCISPSAPVLLIPSTEAPKVTGSDDFSADAMTMQITATASRLYCRISAPSALTQWHVDNLSVEAVDILVSNPLPLFHSNEPLRTVHRNGSSVQAWETTPMTDIELTTQLLNCATFRPVASIPVSRCISADTSTLFAPEFNLPRLANTSLRPDYLQLHGISAAGCSVFSGCLTLWDLRLTLPAPPPLQSLIPLADVTPASVIALDIESVKSCETLHASRSHNQDTATISESCFPRWIFIPDPDARRLTIATADALYTLPLRRHPHLSGAYFWCGSLRPMTLSEMGVTKTAAPGASALPALISRDSFRLPGFIWSSEPSKPYIFPDSGLTLAAPGRVKAVARILRMFPPDLSELL